MNLDRWMHYELKNQTKNKLLGLEPYFTVEPLIGANGIYKQGSYCWFEIDGHAFSYPIERFNYEFKIIEVNEYDNQKITALEKIISLGLATKKQKQIVEIYKLHGKKLDVEKLRIKKRLIDFKNKVNENKKLMVQV